MKKIVMGCICAVCLTMVTGCGVSQKQLRGMDDLLEASKGAKCETIRYYLDEIQKEVRKKIR